MNHYQIDKDEEEVYFPIPVNSTYQNFHSIAPPGGASQVPQVLAKSAHTHPHHHQPHHHQQHQSQKRSRRGHSNHHNHHNNHNPNHHLSHSHNHLPEEPAPHHHHHHHHPHQQQSQRYLHLSSSSSSASPGSRGVILGATTLKPSHPSRRISTTSRSSATAALGIGRKMGTSKVEYVHSDQLMAATYVKNSKAIGFLWGIFSVCYAIITLVVFIQPQWIGARSPASSGYFGLWRHCAVASVMTEMTTTSEFICRGRLDDFSSILNPAFRVATVFVGIAAVVAILSVFGLILFICAPARQAYFIIAMMQTLAAICTGVGLVVFPAGFDAAEVKLTCGPTADRFYLGSCTIRWAYVLAIIGLLDGAVLAILGFVLGSRHLKLSDEFSSGSTRKIHSISGLNGYPPRGGYFYGTDSGPTPSVTYSYASTKRSTMGQGGLQPIVLLPPDAEEYRSKASLYRAEYATPKQNIQL